MKGIIYKATNTVNGKVYIGQTIQPLDARRKQHETASKNPKNTSPLYEDMRRYGTRAFSWEVIKELPWEQYLDGQSKALRQEEAKAISEHKSFMPAFGYNTASAPNDDHMSPRNVTPKTVWLYEIPSGKFAGVYDSIGQANAALGKSNIRPGKLQEFTEPKHLIVGKDVKYVAYGPTSEQHVINYLKKHLAVKIAPGRLERPTKMQK